MVNAGDKTVDQRVVPTLQSSCHRLDGATSDPQNGPRPINALSLHDEVNVMPRCPSTRPLARSCAAVFALGFLLASLARPALPVPAHVHDLEPVSNIPAASIGAPTDYPEPGQVLPVFLALDFDTDYCLQSDGLICSFPSATAINPVQATSLHDGGAGGAFGFLDGNGQFVASSDLDLITHYRCPTAEGDVTLTATVDDIPLAVEPASEIDVATFDDAPVTATRTLFVRARHAHSWELLHNLGPVFISVQTGTPTVNQVIFVSASAPLDTDRCLNLATPCPFAGSVATNDVLV